MRGTTEREMTTRGREGKGSWLASDGTEGAGLRAQDNPHRTGGASLPPPLHFAWGGLFFCTCDVVNPPRSTRGLQFIYIICVAPLSHLARGVCCLLFYCTHSLTFYVR